MEKFTTIKKEVDIDLVAPNPWNPNVQLPEIFRKEVQSIKELGFLGSILVRDMPTGYYEILDGEHRYKACKELGYKTIQIETLGEIEDNQAKMLTILLNNLKGKDDIEKRAKILQELNEGQLSLLPFTSEEIENEKKLFEFDFSQYEKQEKILERQVNNTICFGFTQEEREFYDRVLSLAKDYDMNEIQMLMISLKQFAEIYSNKDENDRLLYMK